MTKEIEYQNRFEKAIISKSTDLKILNEETLTVGPEADALNEILNDQIISKLPPGLKKHFKETYGIVSLEESLHALNAKRAIDWIAKNKGSTETPETLLAACLDHFIKLFKSADSPSKKYSIIFDSNKLLRKRFAPEMLVREISIGENFFEYAVIHQENLFEYEDKNCFFCIREKKLKVPELINKSHERPDFLWYINGIPLLLIEFKTEKSGLAEAVADFINKPTYKIAPFKLAVNDGTDLCLFTEPVQLAPNASFFKWIHFGEKKENDHGVDYKNIDYFIEEFFNKDSYKNFYMYVKHCCLFRADQKRILNARIQQYFGFKFFIDNFSKKTLIFNHSQRSGKSVTMHLIINFLKLKQKPSLIRKIFLYGPNLQITENVLKKQLLSEFDTEQCPAWLVPIDSREEFDECVKDLKNPDFKVFLLNIQKVSTIDDELESAEINQNVLNILDEAHFGEQGELATHRNARINAIQNYLFTATPEDHRISSYLVDSEMHSFTFESALTCDIVCPVTYIKAVYEDLPLKDIVPKIELIKSNTEKRIKEERLSIDFETDETSFPLVISNKTLKTCFRKVQELVNIENKIKYICEFVRNNSPEKFKGKSIVYVKSVEIADAYLTKVKELGVESKLSWATDHSKISERDNNEVHARFTSQGEDCLDVLVAVDKYQMGFDLPALCFVFLDCEIDSKSKMSQIFTRPATKKDGKIQGFCVDLTASDINKKCFKEAYALFNNKEGLLPNNGLIDKDYIDSVIDSIENSVKNLKEPLFESSDKYIEWLLEEGINCKELQKRQESFYNNASLIAKNLNILRLTQAVSSVVKEVRICLLTLEEFKKIYGSVSDPRRDSILINLDKTLAEDPVVAELLKKELLKELSPRPIVDAKEIIPVPFLNNTSSDTMRPVVTPSIRASREDVSFLVKPDAEIATRLIKCIPSSFTAAICNPLISLLKEISNSRHQEKLIEMSQILINSLPTDFNESLRIKICEIFIGEIIPNIWEDPKKTKRLISKTSPTLRSFLKQSNQKTLDKEDWVVIEENSFCTDKSKWATLLNEAFKKFFNVPEIS